MWCSAATQAIRPNDAGGNGWAAAAAHERELPVSIPSPQPTSSTRWSEAWRRRQDQRE